MKMFLQIFVIIALVVLFVKALFPTFDESTTQKTGEGEYIPNVEKGKEAPRKRFNPDANEALIEAVYNKELYTAREALKGGGDENTTTAIQLEDGTKVRIPILIIAVVAEDTAMVNLLVEYKVNLEAKGASGETALMIVSITGNVAIAKLLIRSGAKINATTSSGVTALMFAAADPSRIEVLQFLLERGADKNIINKKGRRAIDLAKSAKNKNAILLLSQ